MPSPVAPVYPPTYLIVNSRGDAVLTAKPQQAVGPLMQVVLTDSGTGGYQTTYPNGYGNNILLTGGSGTNVAASLVVQGQVVTGVIITNNGTGYVVGDLLTIPGGTGDAQVQVTYVPNALDLILTPSASFPTSTLELSGVNALNWGNNIWESLYRLTESFAASTAPGANPVLGGADVTPLLGQLWFDTTTTPGSLNVYVGAGLGDHGPGNSWNTIETSGLASISGTAPIVVTTSGGGSPVINLNTAVNYAVIASSTITNTVTPTALTGDLGLFPGTSVTNFPPGTVSGTQNINNGLANTAKSDAQAAYTVGQGLTPFSNIPAELGTTSPIPGYYQFTGGAAQITTGPLTLNGSATSVWVFQIASTLTTAVSSSIVLTGGALAKNVYWMVGSSATLGVSSTFYGTIIAQASITVNTNAAVTGHLFALTGQVSFDNNTVTATPAGSGAGGGNATISLEILDKITGSVTTGTFTSGETITQAVTGATAVLVGTVPTLGPMTVLASSIIGTDQYWNDVVLMLPFTGTNGGTTTTDVSPLANPVEINTAQPVTIITTDEVFPGYATLQVLPADWLESYALRVPLVYNTPLDIFSSGNPWTIECWAKTTYNGSAFVAYVCGYAASTSGGAYNGFTISLADNNTGSLTLSVDGSEVFTNGYFNSMSQAFTAPEGSWNAIAVTWDGTTGRAFFNGQMLTGTANGWAASLYTHPAVTPYVVLGSAVQDNGTGAPIDITQFRVTNGVARYTANYTPTGPFTTSQLPDATHIWTGNTSLATFTPTSVPTATVNSFTDANITVDQFGRVIAASNGTPSGGGTVTSVGATSSSAGLIIGGSPITTAGTLSFTLNTQLSQLAALNTQGVIVREGTAFGYASSANIITALGYTPYNSTNPSGFLTTNQTIHLTGDVAGTGTTAITTTLATVNGNVGSFGSAYVVPSLTVNAKGLVTAVANNTIPTVSASAAGIAPASGGGTTNFLRADGTWAPPVPALGTVLAVAQTADLTVSGTGFHNSSLQIALSANSFYSFEIMIEINPYVNSMGLQPTYSGTIAASGWRDIFNDGASSGIEYGFYAVNTAIYHDATPIYLEIRGYIATGTAGTFSFGVQTTGGGSATFKKGGYLQMIKTG